MARLDFVAFVFGEGALIPLARASESSVAPNIIGFGHFAKVFGKAALQTAWLGPYFRGAAFSKFSDQKQMQRCP